MGYVNFNKTKHYTYTELLIQSRQVEKFFSVEDKYIKKGKVELTLNLQPTDVSINYKVKLIAHQNRRNVKIYVINPKINIYENGKKVPHLYPDGSLCLYYPEYNEWKYTDYWVDTLIPWTSLWLFYYEIWKETGEWVGGGIHGKKYIPMK